MFDELRYNNRMVFADVGSQLKESCQFISVRAYIHCSTTQYIRRAHQHWEAYPIDKIVNVFHTCQRTPFWLVDTIFREHLWEFRTILCSINILCLCTQNRNLLFIEVHRQVIGNLSACRDDNAMRILQFNDIHHPFESQLVEIQAVTHIIIGRNRFRIIVDHHRAIALLSNGVQRLHTTPVELHRRTDTVGSWT